ncbi:MAG: AEC family transporter, partial [Candidatus Thermoplasmatota archaeon]|nr:AEC family transporter [Candidatus Thermoplasmatota archaeon]
MEINLFQVTFESVATLLGIGLIGFLLIRKKLVPENVLSLLTPLVITIALPSLVFSNVISRFEPSISPNWWQLPLWWMFFTLIAAALTYVFRFVSKKETRREFAMSLFYQNGIFFPLAIIAGMFTDSSQYIIYLFLFTIFFPTFFFNTYNLFYGGSLRPLSLKKILNPVLIATLIALTIKLTSANIIIPTFVLSIFSLLGAMTLPLIMIIIGGNIYVDFRNKGKIYL